MIIKQLSVFLENKSGRLNEVSQLLGDAGINLSALSVADTSEFGILRLIASDPDKAYQVLKAADFSVKLTDVVCLNSPNVPGALAKALNILSSEEVFIEYLYAFSMDKRSANIVLKPDDIEKCIQVLQKHQLELVKASDLYKI
ncbi:ACT domain-containing protein [Sunxiuqinia dokdonensis]|uniref:Amino acid-binding protein n=1 Tax=Sunxiuqinia dokdonensis TaxID=1409788 RepID=A0A0L8VE62_9BACT|nr:ACT domain-containing protein [Sunxiuqinia dokdonensis]KOH46741.1 amino acid-binding protein [Sunxiuqinia dokdonensis]